MERKNYFDYFELGRQIVSGLYFTYQVLRKLRPKWLDESSYSDSKKEFRKFLFKVLWSLFSTASTTYDLVRTFGKSRRPPSFQVGRIANIGILYTNFVLEVVEEYYKRFDGNIPITFNAEYFALALPVIMSASFITYRAKLEDPIPFLNIVWTPSELVSVLISILILSTSKKESLLYARIVYLACCIAFFGTIIPLLWYNLETFKLVRDFSDALSADFYGLIVFAMLADAKTILLMKQIRRKGKELVVLN